MEVESKELDLSGPTDSEFEEDEVNEQVYEDIKAGIELIKKCGILLDFVADPILCTGLTKREREAMARLSVQLDEYLDENDKFYNEEEE